MVIIKHQIDKSNVRFINIFNDCLSSLINVYIFKQYKFPKWKINYDIVKKNQNHIFINRVNDYFQKLIESLSRLFWKGRKWKGTYWPSKWKWYHRHGYWATRKKLLDFDKYRPYRYHEVKGYGKKKLQFWQDHSYYRPLKQTTKFW
ncbi:conserved Plasmodium protein, unknown function [Plasmodium sp. gorilla clade G2]|uniref:conserved Plasmodium protein, unknown function n=1 Tax=Plasmodium sp. gorilla clade G2 TaxID=880535 RepID=UPI000D206F53|nr:conserved Plasmodium protein, unknown function [Plasmodium sp. gorilla clade G2]SOV15510.1 conserved Plasmodium protein, unknown function [Plasmodium sp. gorilla clade G2]